MPAVLADSRLVMALGELKDTADRPLPLERFLYADRMDEILYQPVEVEIRNDALRKAVEADFKGRFKATRDNPGNARPPVLDLTYLPFPNPHPT